MKVSRSYRTPVMERVSHRDKMYTIYSGWEYSKWYCNIVWSHACGKHGITYRSVESICCTPKTDVKSCANYTSFKKKKNHRNF